MIFERDSYCPENITTFGQAEVFAMDVFQWLNGKINPHFPAKQIIFSYSSAPQAMGSSYADIVQINMHNILTDTVSFFDVEARSKLLKGHIIYVITHELLHLEQDFAEYYKKYGKDRDMMDYVIERDCHTMTSYVMNKWLVDGHDSLYLEFDLGDIAYPDLGNFIKFNGKNIREVMLDGLSSFEENRVPSYTKKIEYLISNILSLDKCVTGDYIYNMRDYISDPVNGIPTHTIIMYVYWNRVQLLKQCYVIFNGIMCNPIEIMDCVRPVFIGINNPDYKSCKVSTRIGALADFPGTISISISLDCPNTEYIKDIVYRLPNGVKPITSLY